MPNEFGLGGLRPTVGLRRPEDCLLRRRRPTLGVQRLGRPISIGTEAFGQRSACADRRIVFCVGEGRRLACSTWRGRFQSARRPSADGRPACRMNSAWGGLWPTVGLRRPGRCLLRRRRPTLGVQHLEGPISIGTKAFGRRSACMPNEFGLGGLRPTVGLRRPEDCLLRRRRPTLGVQHLEGPISIGTKAFGRRSACMPNEFGLGRPLANGRPAPTGKVSFASAKADAWRAAPGGADFNRHEGLRPTVGLHAE
jgi:hypothetical protein